MSSRLVALCSALLNGGVQRWRNMKFEPPAFIAAGERADDGVNCSVSAEDHRAVERWVVSHLPGPEAIRSEGREFLHLDQGRVGEHAPSTTSNSPDRIEQGAAASGIPRALEHREARRVDRSRGPPEELQVEDAGGGARDAQASGSVGEALNGLPTASSSIVGGWPCCLRGRRVEFSAGVARYRTRVDAEDASRVASTATVREARSSGAAPGVGDGALVRARTRNCSKPGCQREGCSMPEKPSARVSEPCGIQALRKPDQRRAEQRRFEDQSNGVYWARPSLLRDRDDHREGCDDREEGSAEHDAELTSMAARAPSSGAPPARTPRPTPTASTLGGGVPGLSAFRVQPVRLRGCRATNRRPLQSPTGTAGETAHNAAGRPAANDGTRDGRQALQSKSATLSCDVLIRTESRARITAHV